MLSEAAHSTVDLVVYRVAYFSSQAAEQPYGHGKIENLRAVVEAVLIFEPSPKLLGMPVGAQTPDELLQDQASEVASQEGKLA